MMKRICNVYVIGTRKVMYQNMRKRVILKLIGAIMLLIIAIGGTIIYFANSSFNDHQYIGTVTKQERIADGRNSYYLIFIVDENGVHRELKDTDNIIRGKFNSSNIYNQITVGETYKFTVIGYRIEWLSEYENIIGLEKVDN